MAKILVDYAGRVYLKREIEVTDAELNDIKANGRDCKLYDKLWSEGYGKLLPNDEALIEDVEGMYIFDATGQRLFNSES